MSTEEASKIARHYLGEYLRYVVPVESGYNVLIHLKDGGYTSAFATEAEDLPAVCREAAAQLRAAGWSPGHARLEWTREFDDFTLTLHLEKFSQKLWSGKVYNNGTGWAFNDSSGSLYNGAPIPEAEIVRIIAEWCATNLPSLHLPLFPEPLMPLDPLTDEIDRLKAALHAANARREELWKRAAHAEAILTGILPGPVSDALIDARNHQSRTEGVSAAADWGRTVGRAQVLAAAQAAPVVEWQEHTDFMGNAFWTCIRRPLMLRVQSKGWDLVAIYGESYLELDSGEETGPAGKAACEAAYRRACGLPAIPPCAG